MGDLLERLPNVLMKSLVWFGVKSMHLEGETIINVLINYVTSIKHNKCVFKDLFYSHKLVQNV